MSADNYLPEMEMPSEPEEPETEPGVSFDPLVSVAGDDEGSITMEVQDEDEDEEDEDEEVEVVKKEIRSQQIMFSEDQVAKITADAIDKYEAKRKVRKIEKNKIKEAEEHENKNRQTLQRAMKQPDHSDPWGMVLSGLI